jgi:hypothetical protein
VELGRIAANAVKDIGDDPDEVWVDCAAVDIFKRTITPEIVLSLLAHLSACRAALRPFAEKARAWDRKRPGVGGGMGLTHPLRDFRLASSTLTALDRGEGSSVEVKP